VITGQPQPGGKKLRVGAQFLEARVGREYMSRSSIYMCGPSAMLRELSGYFISSGVLRENLHIEKFYFD